MIEKRRPVYRQMGFWGDATLLDCWKLAVLSAPEKTAVVDLQKTAYSYAELDDLSGRLASYFKTTGVQSGDIVTLKLPGWSEFAIIYLACLKVGAVVNPVCPRCGIKDLLFVLDKCHSKVLFLPPNFKGFSCADYAQTLFDGAPSLLSIVQVEKDNAGTADGVTLKSLLEAYPVYDGQIERDGDDLAAVIFSSGTEGFPKGVMLTHNNIIAAERAFAARINFTSFDTLLMPSPLGHATGFLHGLVMPLMFNARSVLLDIFDADTCLKLIEREQCTCSMGATPFVHDILHALKKHPYDISSLRYFLCGGAAVPRSMIREALAADFKILAVYGSTESVPHAASCLDDPDEKIIERDGSAVPSVEIKVVDSQRRPANEGEEASRGPNVFIGYLDEPELTARAFDDDGWYYSGDLCTIDADGYIRITGRKKDIIVRGGENISSCEVENALHQHPAVSEAAVVAMPDSRMGERVCAFVVLEEGEQTLELDAVKAFFAQIDVAKYKWPERIEIIDTLPRTESGKVKKYMLREEISRKLCGNA
jgi:acyl-CoA synthetase